MGLLSAGGNIPEALYKKGEVLFLLPSEGTVEETRPQYA
jgi:hypothetical protein